MANIEWRYFGKREDFKLSLLLALLCMIFYYMNLNLMTKVLLRANLSLLFNEESRKSNENIYSVVSNNEIASLQSHSMDQGVRQIREKNPRENAFFLSVITFFYTLPLFKKGRKRNLDDADVYEVVPKCSSENLGNALENYWFKERRSNRNPSVIRALFSCYGKKYLLAGFVQFCVKTAFVFIQPAAVGKFVGYFQQGQTHISKGDMYKNAALVIGLSLFGVIYNHNYTQYIIEFGIAVRTAFAALIYRKTLRLKPSAFANISMGNIVTLITKDVFAFETSLIFLNDVWVGSIQTVITAYIIYTRIGLSVLAGVGFVFMIIPLQVLLGRKTSARRLIAAKKTDERIQVTKETFSAIKIIKMYTWEKIFEQTINDYRKKEVKGLAIIYYIKCLILIIGTLVSKLSFYLLMMTYIWTGHYINAEIVYFLQSCFNNLRSYIITSIPMGINQTADLLAAAKRLDAFLNKEELKDGEVFKSSLHPKIYLRNVSAKVNHADVLNDVSLFINKGLMLVTGNIGSGKSALLKTILKEYPVTGGQMLVEGTISYASQDPWLFPSTIKQNILFGQEFNEKRYQEVLQVCALTHDLNQFENGDQTVAGDRAVNLSKGQQSRINLARAIYKDSDIYLLDDCLSSLDTHVSKFVFNRCIREFLKDKIVILVTHNINHIKQVYGNNVLVIENGKTLTIEQQKQTLDKRITYYMDDIDFDYFADRAECDGLETDLSEKHEINDYTEDDREPLLKEKQTDKPANNLYHEDNKPGKVNLRVYLRYYKFAGGIFVLLLVEPKLTGYIVNNFTNSSDFSETLDKRNKIINMYSVVTIAATMLAFVRAFLNFSFCMRASKNLHKAITSTVINTYMYFFDSHFIGNIVNRFSKDIGTIDEYIPLLIYENFRGILVFIGTAALIASTNVFLVIPIVILLLKLYFIRRSYMPTGRAIKRLESASRSPMIGYLNATLEGLTTVRAYEKQTLLISEFDKHQDLYTSAYFMMQCTIRAFGFILDICCALFVAFIVLKFSLFGNDESAGNVGLAVSQAMMLNGLLQWTVRSMSELENNMTSVERVLEYADAETEDKDTGEVKEGWPYQGKIEYREVSLAYTTTNELVLKNISFVIEPRQRIGIVGRTGAGKSSIISALFRLYDFEGKILVDEVNTKSLSLNFLRSKIAIIPQDPVLFTGTIKSNIDPTDRYSDLVIWEALEKVHLKPIITNLQEEVNEGGSSYSSGQKQLLCLARALVSKNKIIVLDEATASMDPETCEDLQKSIKECFADCTVITIAHRMNTVADSDKVMVVDGGRIVEYDTPEALLQNTNGFFYSLNKQSGLLET
ncbi:hypothetical protein NQ317_003473 [Molorchus minor]|uniref:Uncharacterized protein n=1 Tax=Molorchus minor TaxID=1323400 RepID=A0ABQ9K087_9CUCU|nr:hypothetical protein NQ317_003473 [Molorchus minor]